MDFKAFDRIKIEEYSKKAKELYGNTPEYKEMKEEQKNQTAVFVDKAIQIRCDKKV